MKRILLASVALLVLTACDPDVKEGLDLPESMIPDGLQDCKFYRIRDTTGNLMRIVRCPLSVTSVTVPGKNPQYSAVIEAQEKKAANEAAIKKIDAEIQQLEEKKKALQ